MTATLARPSDRNTRAPGRRRRRRGRLVVAVLLVIGLAAGYAIVDALRLPGTDSPIAKLAEWGR